MLTRLVWSALGWFDCSKFPRLFFPETTDCRDRLRQLFGTMNWGEPRQTTYRARLSSIAESYAALESFFVVHGADFQRHIRSVLAISSDAQLVTTASASAAALPGPAAIYVDFFTVISSQYPEILRAFIFNADCAGVMWKSLALLDGGFDSPSLLQTFTRRLCYSEHMQMFAATTTQSDRAELWKALCTDGKFWSFFSTLGVTEFYEVLTIFRIFHEAGDAAERLEIFFSSEASETVLARVRRSVPLELGPNLKTRCVVLRLSGACALLLKYRNNLYGKIQNFEWKLAHAVADRLRVTAAIETAYSFIPKDLHSPVHRSAREFPSLFRSLGADLLFEIPDSEIFQEAGAENLFLLSSFQRLSDFWTAAKISPWPLLERYLNAESAVLKAKEVALVWSGRRLMNFVQAAGPRSTRIDVHLMALVVKHRHIDIEDLADAFKEDELRQVFMTLDDFVASRSGRASRLDCAVCNLRFTNNRAVQLCHWKTGNHEVCMACVRACFKGNTLTCPSCRRIVFQARVLTP